MRYEDLEITPVVSAQANTTPLGGCTLSDGVIEAMGEAAKWHVDTGELWDAAGARLARVTGTEDACPTTGAAAGVAISVAAVIAGTDVSRIQSLPGPVAGPTEILLQKGHSISYSGAPIGQMIALGGGRVREVGAVNETLPAHIENAITERTAAIVFVTSHTHAAQRRSVPLEEVVAIGHRHGLPVIVDAANEEDLVRWSALGADLVCYSGPKSLGAPTSGFICGSKQLTAACRAQYTGIARPMKVGKESLMGLLRAVDEYVAVTPEARGGGTAPADGGPGAPPERPRRADGTGHEGRVGPGDLPRAAHRRPTGGRAGRRRAGRRGAEGDTRRVPARLQDAPRSAGDRPQGPERGR
ncbi:hypothetical protein CJD44_09595 [Streptomyces sp. alain-838]|nr:DegT/DnrJ/EryC1/StrS family aminotransferase [Streptomyces sp. alain-838]PAK26547.1 hypothetical protein CJD44_09595 [Streptomyces sp. alain-838]